MNINNNYYSILGIDRSATSEVIRREVNRLLRSFQGQGQGIKIGKNDKDKARIKELMKIRNILLDPESRSEYDNQLDSTTIDSPNTNLSNSSDNSVSKGNNSNVLAKNYYSIALLIDTSGSMSGQYLIDAKNALHCFLDKLSDIDNRVALVSFGCRTGIICSLTDNISEIREGIDSLTAKNGTPLLQALICTGEGVLINCSDEKMIVIATDGHPSESQTEILSYANQLKDQDVRIIVIGIGNGIPEDFLKKLASSTDDYFFAKASVELKKIYQTISNGLAKSQ